MRRATTTAFVKNALNILRVGPFCLQFPSVAAASGSNTSGLSHRSKTTTTASSITAQTLEKRVHNVQVFDVKVLETRPDTSSLCLLTPKFESARSSRMVHLRAVSMIRGGERGIRAAIKASPKPLSEPRKLRRVVSSSSTTARDTDPPQAPKRVRHRSTSSMEVLEQQAPRRPQTSYNLFCREKVPLLKRDQPYMHHNAMSRHLGQLWKALADSDKERYKKAAVKDRLRFNQELRGRTAA
eukprot:jgi/Ulvmu1/12518/UM090_0005.1